MEFWEPLSDELCTSLTVTGSSYEAHASTCAQTGRLPDSAQTTCSVYLHRLLRLRL